MKYKALLIKNWIIHQISPLGWATLITRALPELLEYNQRFSAYYVNERTTWSQTEIDVISWYLRKIYHTEIPADILCDNGYMDNYWDLVGISFFDNNDVWRNFGNKILNLFRK